VPVVFPPFERIDEHAVGLGDGPELLGRPRVVHIDVRVHLESLPAIGLLDLVVRGGW